MKLCGSINVLYHGSGLCFVNLLCKRTFLNLSQEDVDLNVTAVFNYSLQFVIVLLIFS